MRSRIILVSFILLLSGCATTAPYLTPVQTGSGNESIFHNASGTPYFTKTGEKTDVSVGALTDMAPYMCLDIIVVNKSTQKIHVSQSDVVLLNSGGTMVNTAGLREIAYKTHGVIPPEQKDTAYQAFEGGMSFLTGGIFWLGESSNQQAAQGA